MAAPAAPRFAFAWAALACALCTLALGFPALGGRFLVSAHSDQYLAGYAFREFAAQTLRSTGGFPLWNPYLFGGMPYVAAMHGDIFYPTFLLRLILPTDVAMTWGFILHVFLAGLFTYGFLRATGLGFHAALAGSVAYMMSGNVAALVSPGHDGKLFVSALLPLQLWLLLLGVKQGRAWVWGAFALAIGLAVLSPHPQLLQYSLLLTGAFGLYTAWASVRADELPRRVAIRRLGAALAAVALGGAMGAVQYLPVRHYVPWSTRSGGLPGYETATSYSLPIEELLNTYLPQFSGVLDHYWGRNGIHLHSEYVGAAVLVLMGAAFGVRVARLRPWMWFWAGALIVSVLWALGGNTPFYRLVYAVVPGTKYFRAPSTILFIVSFAVAVLAAIGTERVLAREVGRRYAIGWIAAGAVVALVASTGLFTNLATSLVMGFPYDPGTVAGLAERSEANRGAVIVGAWRSLLFVGAACGVILGLLSKRLTLRVAAPALIAILALDLFSVERAYWQFAPRARRLYAADGIVDYLRRQSEPGRVLAIDATGGAGHDPLLFADGLMVHRIRSALGYHGNQLAPYDSLAGGKYSGHRNVLRSTFWRLANVRYLLTNVPEVPLPGSQRVVGPVRTWLGTEVFLYRLPGDNPAAWVATAIMKVPGNETYGVVLDERFDPATIAIFDTVANVQGRQLTAAPAPASTRARVSRYEPGHITVQLDGPAAEGSALVVSENYYPGWMATVDGRPAPVGRADFALIGVALPAGGRTVDLVFRSRPYEVGKAITLLAIGLSLIALGGGAVIDRRSRGRPRD